MGLAGTPTADLSIVRSRGSLRSILAPLRECGQPVVLVPTMGALHQGHLSLVDLARSEGGQVVVSIFVNPKQFAPTEDFGSYPRTEEADLDALRAVGAHVAYLPQMEDLYPEGFDTVVSVPGLSAPLDGASRGPGYFAGIATVVTKLLMQVRPDAAIFGEKDYQQLLVIRRVVTDLEIGTKIIGAPIVREPDGLAMSSRNRYLTADERQVAGCLNAIMAETIGHLRDGVVVAEALTSGRAALEREGLAPIHYYEVRLDPALTEPDQDAPLPAGAPARLFSAVMLGRTRLIDNMPV